MNRFSLKPHGNPSTRGAPPDPRARARRTVLALEGVTAVAAFGGGAVMIADPSGQLIGFPPAMLDRIPFTSWLLPGIALVGSNGVVPTVVALATMRGEEWTSRFGHIAVGCVLFAWPVTETALFGYPLTGEPVWLRPVVAGTGAAIAGIGVWLRSTAPSSGAGRRVRVEST
jgi:hypothetical protein